jgi:dTDP-4-amino-4,6-dideoxygalactose transaminase
MSRIPLIKPYMTDAIKARVMAVLDSGHLTEGPVTHELENIFARYVGTAHAIAVTSCTTGLELALRAVGIGPGDEVIVPDYTYPATAGAVAMVGGTPVIVDIEPNTLLISREAAEAAVTPRTRAIVPVSLFGNPLDYDWLNAFRQRHGLTIIEDAACSVGASRQGRMVGSFADISVFSLHPRKFITTGEGGMITTDNVVWASWMQSFKHFGMAVTDSARESVVFERMGSNYKLSSVQAAIGLGQMQDVGMLLAERRRLAARYDELLAHVPGVTLPVTTAGGEHSWQTYTVGVPNRDAVMRTMRADGIEVQIGTYALHRHPAFTTGACRLAGAYPGSDAAFERTLALPIYHGLTDEEQLAVVQALKELVAGCAGTDMPHR